MPAAKTLIICSIAAFTPMVVVAATQYEVIADSMTIEASEAEGKLLFFTAPSR